MAQTNITFYQILNDNKDKTLCQLLAKINNAGHKTVVRFKDEEYQEQINKILWSFNQKEFIAHGSKNDPFPERQPIYLTTSEEIPNKASISLLVGNIDVTDNDFDRIIFVFDNSSKEELEFAQEKYTFYKQANFPVEYWQQNINGAWEKKGV